MIFMYDDIVYFLYNVGTSITWKRYWAHTSTAKIDIHIYFTLPLLCFCSYLYYIIVDSALLCGHSYQLRLSGYRNLHCSAWINRGHSRGYRCAERLEQEVGSASLDDGQLPGRNELYQRSFSRFVSLIVFKLMLLVCVCVILIYLSYE